MCSRNCTYSPEVCASMENAEYTYKYVEPSLGECCGHCEPKKSTFQKRNETK